MDILEDLLRKMGFLTGMASHDQARMFEGSVQVYDYDSIGQCVSITVYCRVIRVFAVNRTGVKPRHENAKTNHVSYISKIGHTMGSLAEKKSIHPPQSSSPSPPSALTTLNFYSLRIIRLITLQNGTPLPLLIPFPPLFRFIQ